MLDPRTCTTLRRAAAACAAVLVTVPAAAAGQEPPPADAVPVKVTVTAPSSVTKAALKKGVTVKVTCAPGCSVRLSLSGPIGIVTEKTVRVADGASATAKLKATAAQVKAIKKGAKLSVVALATGIDGGRGNATKSMKVR